MSPAKILAPLLGYDSGFVSVDSVRIRLGQQFLRKTPATWVAGIVSGKLARSRTLPYFRLRVEENHQDVINEQPFFQGWEVDMAGETVDIRCNVRRDFITSSHHPDW